MFEFFENIWVDYFVGGFFRTQSAAGPPASLVQADKEYEEFLQWQKKQRQHKEFSIGRAEYRSIDNRVKKDSGSLHL